MKNAMVFIKLVFKVPHIVCSSGTIKVLRINI